MGWLAGALRGHDLDVAQAQADADAADEQIAATRWWQWIKRERLKSQRLKALNRLKDLDEQLQTLWR